MSPPRFPIPPETLVSEPRKRCTAVLVGGILALALTFPARGMADQPMPATPSRVVAIGDIHGAYDNLISILHKAELIDRRDRWSGGDATLVQTGDFIDRGADSVKVARYLRKLQKQAEKDGGQVIVLLGNHEVLNLIGDLRYVTRDILSAYVDSRSEARHTFYCNDYAKHIRRKAAMAEQEVPTQRVVLSQCQNAQAFGLVEYIEALGPNGELGEWLRTLPAVVQLGEMVFLHGGLSPELAGRKLDEINRTVAEQLAAFDRGHAYLLENRHILSTTHLRDVLATARQLAAEATAKEREIPEPIRPLLDFESSLLIHADGPFWFRGYAKWEDDEGNEKLDAILEPLGARRVVVGHTPQDRHDIVSRFDQRVFLIDTGMLTTYYKGQPSALEFRDGAIRALYVDQDPVVLVPAVETGETGANQPTG